MLIRELRLDEKEQYNSVAIHPLQTWEWGDFRQTTGLEIVRLGAFDGQNIKKTYTITLHSIPKNSYFIGYLPKSAVPDETLFEALNRIGRQKKCIFIKIEPDLKKPFIPGQKNDFSSAEKILKANGCQPGRPMFTRYNFILDLTRSETELLQNMKPKTRYNVRLAEKRGVKITLDNSDLAFSQYLKLTQETTKRQKFYAHTSAYHTKMWKILNQAGIAHLLKATYQGQVLVAWILFKWRDVLYYPYGASSSQHREVMASNLMMWEAIRFGQKIGCTSFDMWGCLGPDPDPKDPWYGFHRFKEGYGPQLYQTVGSWDYIINLPAYKLYRLVDKARWKWLRLKAVMS